MGGARPCLANDPRVTTELGLPRDTRPPMEEPFACTSVHTVVRAHSHCFGPSDNRSLPGLRALRQPHRVREHFVDVSGAEEVGVGCDYGAAVSGGASEPDDGAPGDRGVGSEYGGKRERG